MSRHFQKGGMIRAGGCYTCSYCGKRTRETGMGESAVQMCALCYEISGLENSYADGACTKEEYEKRMMELKGGAK